MEFFIKYIFIGFLNTALHWFVFYILYMRGLKQLFCNFFGFCCAVVFSYIINSKFNFNSKQSLSNFGLFFLFMSMLNLSLGKLADNLKLLPFFTLILTSSLSLVLGYLLSKNIVFKKVK